MQQNYPIRFLNLYPPKWATCSLSTKTTEDASEDASENASENASEDASENASENASEDASEDASGPLWNRG